MVGINSPTQAPWVVLKFGGTSVANASNWAQIAVVVAQRRKQGKRVLIVHSAVSGISNQLEAIAHCNSRRDHGAAVSNIIARHIELGKTLGVDASAILSLEFCELHDLASGVGLIGEASLRAQARLMALGELMATRLGAAYLQTRDLPVRWCDARAHLQAQAHANRSEAQQILSAQCDFVADAALQTQFDTLGDIVLSQGFIARNERGDTVLLGRGGSDTSAAYFGAKLQAERVEIWTDVAGMFTANPRQIPQARLLKALSYDEAQEIASAGAKVLHPRCLPPVRAANIPMWVMSTAQPELPGTVIHDGAPKRAQIKAIAVRQQQTLINMETDAMWQQVGFLADAFGCFKRLELSIDLMATSESMVTVTLDSAANVLSGEVLNQLLRELSAYCKPEIRQGCASVSLVGRNLRKLLPQLKPMLDLLSEHEVYLFTQAANDLNFSIVVDGAHADALAEKLHALLIGAEDDVLGASWSALNAGCKSEWS